MVFNQIEIFVLEHSVLSLLNEVVSSVSKIDQMALTAILPTQVDASET